MAEDAHPRPRVYLAGPPYAEEYRRRAEALVREHGWEPVDPMRRDFRGRTEGNEAEIVEGDLAEIASCEALLAAFTTPDEGTAMEAWYAHTVGKRVVVYTGGTPPHPWTVYVADAVCAYLDEAVRALALGKVQRAAAVARSEAMADWALQRTWDSPNGTVRYDVCGNGPPLVLVHGTPASAYVWRHVVAELASAWTVYVYDLLGYGSSEKRDGQDVSLGAQTRLLCQLLDFWGLEEPAIVGHDFGGAITLRTHLLERRPFSAIALLDPVAVGPWGSPFFRLVRDNIEVFEQMPATIHEAIVAAYLRGAFHRRMSDEALAPYVQPWLGAEGQDAFYRQIAQADQRYTDEVEPLYREIAVPVLILWGEEDEWIRPETGRRLQALIPHSLLQPIPAAGHFLQEDAPHEVASHLARFFSNATEQASAGDSS